MMISRKRRNSPTPTSSEISSKRARILSNTWQSEEDITVDRVLRSGNYKHTRRTRVIGESSGEISIDRDGRFTERKHKSGRVSGSISLDCIFQGKKVDISFNFNCDGILMTCQLTNRNLAPHKHHH